MGDYSHVEISLPEGWIGWFERAGAELGEHDSPDDVGDTYCSWSQARYGTEDDAVKAWVGWLANHGVEFNVSDDGCGGMWNESTQYYRLGEDGVECVRESLTPDGEIVMSKTIWEMLLEQNSGDDLFAEVAKRFAPVPYTEREPVTIDPLPDPPPVIVPETSPVVVLLNGSQADFLRVRLADELTLTPLERAIAEQLPAPAS